MLAGSALGGSADHVRLTNFALELHHCGRADGSHVQLFRCSPFRTREQNAASFSYSSSSGAPSTLPVTELTE